MSKIILKSSDDKFFVLDVGTAQCSTTLKTMFDSCGFPTNEIITIALPNINSNILSKIVNWATFHRLLPASLENEAILWRNQFFNVERNTLFQLILAADYLNMKELLEFACRTVAKLIDGKTAQEIRRILNISNDYTPFEEDKMRKFHYS